MADDLELMLSCSDSASSESECEEALDISGSEAEESEEELEMEVTGILPRNIVASASNARAGAEGQEGKVTGILPGNSNVASVSNAGAEARVVEKEKNNNKSKVQNTEGVELFPPAGSKMRKTSDAWRYGGLKKNEKGKLLTDKMYCALCPKTFKYNKSP